VAKTKKTGPSSLETQKTLPIAGQLPSNRNPSTGAEIKIPAQKAAKRMGKKMGRREEGGRRKGRGKVFLAHVGMDRRLRCCSGADEKQIDLGRIKIKRKGRR